MSPVLNPIPDFSSSSSNTVLPRNPMSPNAYRSPSTIENVMMNHFLSSVSSMVGSPTCTFRKPLLRYTSLIRSTSLATSSRFKMPASVNNEGRPLPVNVPHTDTHSRVARTLNISFRVADFDPSKMTDLM